MPLVSILTPFAVEPLTGPLRRLPQALVSRPTARDVALAVCPEELDRPYFKARRWGVEEATQLLVLQAPFCPCEHMARSAFLQRASADCRKPSMPDPLGRLGNAPDTGTPRITCLPPRSALISDTPLIQHIVLDRLKRAPAVFRHPMLVWNFIKNEDHFFSPNQRSRKAGTRCFSTQWVKIPRDIKFYLVTSPEKAYHRLDLR